MLLTGLMLFVAFRLAASEDDADSIDRMPRFHGALRGRYEVAFDDDTRQRFQLRNARLSIEGLITQNIDWFVQADLCDRGKMKILDVWARFEPLPGLRFQAGQFRLPFGTDCFKAPANYIFANRSFIGKNICNVRGVGAKVAWTHRALTLEAGAFNPTSITDQERWCHSLAYAAKGSLALPGGLTLASGFKTVVPDAVRINLAGASLSWRHRELTLEGEYIYKHYTRSAHVDAHAWNLWADYGFPIRRGLFNRASIQGRWDAMTDHSSGIRNASGRLVTDDSARKRITVGATLSYLHKVVKCDFRLDYEKYFYRHGTIPPGPDAADKLCAEVVVKF